MTNHLLGWVRQKPETVVRWHQTRDPRGCRDSKDGTTTGKYSFASTCLAGCSRLKTKKEKRKKCGHSGHLTNFKTYEFVCAPSWVHMIHVGLVCKIQAQVKRSHLLFTARALWQIHLTSRIPEYSCGTVAVQSCSLANTFLLVWAGNVRLPLPQTTHLFSYSALCTKDTPLRLWNGFHLQPLFILLLLCFFLNFIVSLQSVSALQTTHKKYWNWNDMTVFHWNAIKL